MLWQQKMPLADEGFGAPASRSHLDLRVLCKGSVAYSQHFWKETLWRTA